MIDFSAAPESPVLVIGSAGIDIIGRLKKDYQKGTSNPGRIRTSFGGVARNVAENLARLGQPVRLITAVGTDSRGDDLIDQIASAGVDINAVLRSDDFATGTYLGVVNDKGEFQFGIDDLRTTRLITPDYLREHVELFKTASLLFLDANLEPSTIKTALSLARRSRIRVCADPTSKILAGRLCPHISQLFLITPNSTEASILCGNNLTSLEPLQMMETAKILVGLGAGIVLITLAEFGVVYATSESSGHVPSIRTEILDPTGAGDALTATVIFSLLNNISLDDGVRLGVSAASLTLQFRGTVLPDLSLEKLYDHLLI